MPTEPSIAVRRILSWASTTSVSEVDGLSVARSTLISVCMVPYVLRSFFVIFCINSFPYHEDRKPSRAISLRKKVLKKMLLRGFQCTLNNKASNPTNTILYLFLFLSNTLTRSPSDGDLSVDQEPVPYIAPDGSLLMAPSPIITQPRKDEGASFEELLKKLKKEISAKKPRKSWPQVAVPSWRVPAFCCWYSSLQKGVALPPPPNMTNLQEHFCLHFTLSARRYFKLSYGFIV